MRLSLRALALAGCAWLVCAQAHAEPAPAWTARAVALAERVHSENLLVTDRTRAARAREAERLSGRARLQVLYDLAADDIVGSSAERAAISLPAFEHEARAQNDARFLAMARMLHAYSPSMDGDYLQARRNLETELARTTDVYAIAAGQRLRAYALADLGLVGNALEAASAGLLRLPADADTNTLRSGLQDALSYTSVRIGDMESAFEHLERSVELDNAAGHPIDGLTVIHATAGMLAQAGQMRAALHLASLDEDLAARAGGSSDRFFASLLCARVSLAAHDYARTVRCGDRGRAIENAPPEYITRLLTLRATALARLGDGRQARQALTELQQLAARRGDPALVEKIDSIEPEVLFAEGRFRDAFLSMRTVHDASEQNVLRRFNDGVKELRASMENEVARADERAAAQAVRAQLQQRATQGLAAATVLAVACFLAALAIAFLIYRSRRNMLKAVSRAEELLARRGAAPQSLTHVSTSPMQRLNNIMDEIERRDDELERAFRALETARAAAEEANVAKSQFLATMSHELRTPLNAIIGYSEMLMEDAEVSRVGAAHDDLSRIRGAGHRLLVMISDLLDLAKVEAGRMIAEANDVDVAAMLDEIVATVAPSAEANGNTIVTQYNHTLGSAHTDEFKLSQCLLNLMSNAAKFTKDGNVHLRAWREIDWLCFEVADNGIGISSETQARLFQPFVQADASTTRAFGGTGLGLAITRRLAELLGGDVSVRSELGKGATFTLRVPAVLPGAHELKERGAAA